MGAEATGLLELFLTGGPWGITFYLWFENQKLNKERLADQKALTALYQSIVLKTQDES